MTAPATSARLHFVKSPLGPGHCSRGGNSKRKTCSFSALSVYVFSGFALFTGQEYLSDAIEKANSVGIGRFGYGLVLCKFGKGGTPWMLAFSFGGQKMAFNFKFMVAALGLAFASACNVENASDPIAMAGAPVAQPDFRVASFDVIVPSSLVVSEANSLKPYADIVWRADPPGDRYAQVDAVMTDAVRRGVAGLNGPRPVNVQLVMTRFHAQTDLVRYSFSGGEHEIEFDMTVTDAATGEVLIDNRHVDLTFKAFGGQAARDAEAAGQGPKVRINDHVAAGIYEELTKPYRL